MWAALLAPCLSTFSMLRLHDVVEYSLRSRCGSGQRGDFRRELVSTDRGNQAARLFDHRSGGLKQGGNRSLTLDDFGETRRRHIAGIMTQRRIDGAVDDGEGRAGRWRGWFRGHAAPPVAWWMT